LWVNSPAGHGDQLAANAAVSQGSRYARVAYTVPVADDGWRVGANASYLNYSLIGVNGQGTSQSVGLEARYPIVRARMQNLFLALNADQKKFDNQFNGATSTQYGMDTGSVGLSGNVFDNWGGGGANSMGLTWTGGHRNSQVGTTAASFNKVRYNVSRQQTITPALSLFVGLDGQTSRDNLDTSEAFYLGGAYGVRAYPTNEGRGSSGELAKLELRWRMDDSMVFTGFYDHGQVRNRDGAPSYSLKGVGVALAWQASSDLNLSATLARRVGSNPNPNTSTGNDQDGSLTQNRLWLAATLSY
jgi:hemolysin activation/secretion protein